jgi:hypothetical protein
MAFAPRTVSETHRRNFNTPPLAFQQLDTKSSTSADLSANPPIVLPRGVFPLLFEALTEPPHQQVFWDVLPQNAHPTFSIIENFKKLSLRSDMTGTFQVTAKIGQNDPNPMVYNVVFVEVIASQAAPPVYAPVSQLQGIPMADLAIKVSSGDGSHPAFSGSLTVALSDGGQSGDTFVNKIKLKDLQNGSGSTTPSTGSTVTGTYLKTTNGQPVGTRTAHEAVNGGFPIVDTDDGSGSDQNRHFPGDNSTACSVAPTDNTGRARTMRFFDPPVTNNFNVHWKDGQGNFDHSTELRSIDGEQFYKTALAAISTDAPDTIAIFAVINWRVNFTGSVTYQDQNVNGVTLHMPSWSATGGAGVFGDASWSIVSGGLDPTAQHMEVWPPNYVNSEQTIFDPPAQPDLQPGNP